MEAYYHFKQFPSSRLRPEQVEYIKMKMNLKLVQGQSVKPAHVWLLELT